MISHLIQIALRVRWAVLLATIVTVAAGLFAFTQQPIDAYPDISSLMVQVITVYPGRAPEEVERQVTVPVEVAMRNVPKVEVIRSRTIFGLSVVQMIFEEGTELFWARQRVMEKLAGLNLPPGADAELGPPNTAFDEILRYELVSDGTHTLMQLREINDWVVIPRMLRVAGVSDVANFGGMAKQFSVTFRPADLSRFGLSLNDVVDAVRSNNATAGGSVMRRGSMSYVIRSSGNIENVRQIESIFVKSAGGAPVYLRDVANVDLDGRPPDGMLGKDQVEDTVGGIVVMRRGQNPSAVLTRLGGAIRDLNKSGLPGGMSVEPFYNREQLVDNTLHTVGHSVVLGITLVVLVLLLFLGRPSMAFLVAITIPFSLLFALVLMYLTNIPIGLLSIGAIDFGIIVDGAIIMAENIARRLGEEKHRHLVATSLLTCRENADKLINLSPQRQRGTMQTILAAVLEMERSVFFSVLMIIVAYLPLLSLTRIEGLLFRPMALTMVYALLGALVFALFVLPVLATYFYRHGYEEWENPLLVLVRPLYASAIRGLIACRWLVLTVVLAVLALVCIKVAAKLGIEFLPYMDEGVIYVRASFPEGTSLQQTHAFAKRFREIVREFPDFEFVVTNSGRNDSGTDPFPPNRLEMMIGPKLREYWSPEFNGKPKQVLVAALGAKLRTEFPTTRFNFTQPIIDNVLEDTNGTSANLAVEFSGPDSDVLLDLARQTVEMLKSVPGAVDVNIEQEGPQPQLLIQPDRALCASYKVRIDDVTKLINTALGGDPIGVVYEGERKFDIVAKFDRQSVNSPQAIGGLPIFTAEGVPVPLSQVARIELVDGQTLIARENSYRRITVRTDIVGRDQNGFVREAQEVFRNTLEKNVPAGYRVNWIGMFENLEHAIRHFQIVLPITVLLLLGMLLITFRSVKAAMLLLLSLPFALIGGVVALKLRGMNVNVSTCVGFAALFGVSIMNGVLMVRSITAHRLDGMELRAAILQGALDCLRPILLASLVAILGLLPASLATGLGSDVQRPLATVIVWGLFSSTILTLFVVPVLYDLFNPGLPASDEVPRETLVS
jgi:cobalt-zinc-cadmium resistance protein CzcA